MTSRLARLRQSMRFMRGNILVLSITGAVGMFSRMMAFPYASLYLRELGGSPSDIGFVNSLAPIAGLILFPIAGYICDRSGRVNLIVTSGLLSASTCLLYVFAPSWQIYALASVLRGTNTLQFPPSSAIVADSLAPDDRGKGIAMMSTFRGIPAIFAPYVAGIALNRFGVNMGMRYLFFVLFLATLASALISKRFLVETAPVARTRITFGELAGVIGKTYRGVPALLRTMPGALRAHLFVIILCFVAACMASPFWVIYAVDHIGLDAEQWGLILFAENIVRTGAYTITGQVVDRYGRTRCMLAALCVVTIAAPAFALATSFGATMVIRLLIGISGSLFIPASSALMADRVPREQRGRIMAAMGRGSAMLAPAAGGTGGPGTGYLITLPLMLASFSAGFLYMIHPSAPWIAMAIAMTGAVALTAFCIRDATRAES